VLTRPCPYCFRASYVPTAAARRFIERFGDKDDLKAKVRVSTPFRYYKKRERFEKYMEARAKRRSVDCRAGGGGALRLHAKLWGDFTRQQKARYQQRLRANRARG
jgi:hypothetical protein